MASLSGLTSLSVDKLTIRKPRPSFEKQDVFEVFIRNPEGFSRYESNTATWSPLDNQHVPGTQDMYDHVDASVANVYEQIAELQSSIQSTNQHLLDTIVQIGTLSQQVTAQGAQIDALSGKVEEQSQETGGLWSTLESVIGWINFIGSMLSRIEGILVTLGLL